MYQDVKVDDTCLRGKFVISAEDIKKLLPEKIRKDVESIHVYVDLGQPRWVIYLKENPGTYNYVPFSREIIYHSYGTRVHYGVIYLWRTAKYLRDKYLNKGAEKKVYATYLCRPHHMYLLREVKQYWLEDEGGPGYSEKTKWFRAFP